MELIFKELFALETLFLPLCQPIFAFLLRISAVSQLPELWPFHSPAVLSFFSTAFHSGYK